MTDSVYAYYISVLLWPSNMLRNIQEPNAHLRSVVFPSLMGFLGGSYWLRYGFLRADLTMISVNVVGVTLMGFYLLFYTYYSESRVGTLTKIAVVVAIISGMLVLVELYGVQIVDPLGFTCMIFNIVNFGAPLAGVGIVLKKKCCDSLPLPLCTANLLVSAQWCLYGMLVNDIYIIIPNAAGVFLALLQISMFLVFPRQAGSKAPLSLCFGCLDFELDEKQNSVDIEKAFAQDLWLKRNTTFQSSLPPLSRIPKPKKNCLTLIRTANVFPSGSVSANSSDTAITVLPNWSLTPSASHPELAPQQLDSEEVERDQMFNRMHEIDDLEKQWGENELKRTMSAPDLAESSVLSVRQAADELNLS
ncbi:Sugar transporter SWEET [Aphelenchoides bicaudatus]|nr:Sugar transporter SWEET [Aphelenchoides bicaudatus]